LFELLETTGISGGTFHHGDCPLGAGGGTGEHDLEQILEPPQLHFDPVEVTVKVGQLLLYLVEPIEFSVDIVEPDIK
jgi:hypothetical protein